MKFFPFPDHFGQDLPQGLLDVFRRFEAAVFHTLAQSRKDLFGGVYADIGRDEKLLQFIQQIFIHAMKGF